MIIRVPLSKKTIDGVRGDYPLVRLRVMTKLGDYVDLPFLIDTGADLPCIPTNLALEEGIPFDRSQPGMVGGLVGRTKRFRGAIRVKIANRTHAWPCYFLETPESGGSAIPVIGRAGFREDYDFCMDDEFVTLTRRTVFRRWWRAIWQFLSRPFVTVRSGDEPL